MAVLIAGPFECGCFAIHDGAHVWDGSEWRGFGAPEHYPTFKAAFVALRVAKRKHRRTYRTAA